MDFDNPDNRKYMMVTCGLIILSLWFIALWVESEKLGYTGAMLLLPLIALGIWTGVGYDEESVYDKQARVKAKRERFKRGVDNDL